MFRVIGNGEDICELGQRKAHRYKFGAINSESAWRTHATARLSLATKYA